jgi:hypothetical protein
MTDTTTTTEPAKRGRNGSVILTDRMCEKRVAQRVKIYDRKCPGLHVSVTTAGVATFSFKFTDPATGKQRTSWLGVYNPETFTGQNRRLATRTDKHCQRAHIIFTAAGTAAVRRDRASAGGEKRPFPKSLPARR